MIVEKTKRYIIFIFGLFISSVGVALITKADLGTSPISSIPYVVSLNFPFTLGEFTIYFSLFLILLQLLILKKDFKLVQILQIPVSIAYGYFIDLGMQLLNFIHTENYVVMLLYLFLGCLILAVGIYLEVLANVIMLPGESFVRAIVTRWHVDFGNMKVVFDVSMAIIALLLSFLFCGNIQGVREGTIVAAIFVGLFVKFMNSIFYFLPALLFHSEESI